MLSSSRRWMRRLERGAMLFVLCWFVAGAATWAEPPSKEPDKQKIDPFSDENAAGKKPEPEKSNPTSEELRWGSDLTKGLKEARAKGGLVFVDFTGATCVNCKINEQKVFSKSSDVRSLLRRYTLEQLYTDIVPEKYYTPEELKQFGPESDRQKKDAERNAAFQQEKFKSAALPLYVILKPTAENGGFEEVARYDLGRITDVGAFIDFLKKPLEGSQPTRNPAEDKSAEPRITFTPTIALADPKVPLSQVKPPADQTFEVRRGQVFVLIIRGVPRDGFHTYPFTMRSKDQDAKQLGTIKIESEHFTPLWPAYESEAEFKDEGEGIGILLEHEKPFLLVQEVYLKPTAPAGQASQLTVKIHSQQCANEGKPGGCRWEDFTLRVPVNVSNGPASEPAPELTKRLEVPPSSPTVITATAKDKNPPTSNKSQRPPNKKDQKGLLASILKAILGGFVSLLTPCVFPMIPITVSIFLKKAEAKQSNAILHASIYSLTIVFVLTIAGVALLGILVDISQHYITNFLLGGIFIFFALSLLGMYEIVLPSSLTNLTASHEGGSGMVGTVFQALTFSIVSFACVGPIFGGFIAIESTGQSAVVGFIHRVLPVLAFSAAFASPFFLLALFPGLLKSMPKSGSWMNAVKVVMGFLELAAAFKFLRAAELYARGKSEWLTFDLALGIYVALSFACGLYLLNVFRLPHDHGAPDSIGVPRLLFSLTFLSLGLYLLPGLFKDQDGKSQKPRGDVYEWVESFLLPDTSVEDGGSTSPNTQQTRLGKEGPDAGKIRLVWMTNVEEAMARAARENKPIFFDFTGLT